MLEFNFRYLTSKTKVSIDNETIKIKIGIINTEIKKQNIKALYIAYNKDFNELILRYDNEKGRIKNKKIIFSSGENAAIELADYLVENTNCEDLRTLDKKEALKKLKATDSQKIGFIIAAIIMFIIPTVIFLPQFMHYFDNGKQTVNIAQIISNTDLTTSNVTVTGGYLIDGIWFQTTTTSKGSSTTSAYDYFPLVPLNWKENDPIKVIVKTDELTQDQIDDLFSQEEFTGILQNKLWEGGLGSDETDFFNKQYPNYKLDDNLIILDMGYTMYGVFVIIYIVVLVILLIILLIVRRKLK